jgi:hypothetical protein
MKMNPRDLPSDPAILYQMVTDLWNKNAHKTSAKIEHDHNDERCKYIRTKTRKHLDKIINGNQE